MKPCAKYVSAFIFFPTWQHRVQDAERPIIISQSTYFTSDLVLFNLVCMVMQKMFLAFCIGIDFVCLTIDAIQMASALTPVLRNTNVVAQFELKIEFHDLRDDEYDYCLYGRTFKAMLRYSIYL